MAKWGRLAFSSEPDKLNDDDENIIIHFSHIVIHISSFQSQKVTASSWIFLTYFRRFYIHFIWRFFLQSEETIPSKIWRIQVIANESKLFLFVVPIPNTKSLYSIENHLQFQIVVGMSVKQGVNIFLKAHRTEMN